MARVPVVESPCPIAGKDLPAGSTEHCGLCDRQVHNLDLMSESERVTFMAACSGKVCVAYTVRVQAVRPPAAGSRRRSLGPAAIAAALVSLPVAAQDPLIGATSPGSDARDLPACDEYVEIIVGGVDKGDQAEWRDDGKDAPPDLPSIEDDGR